MGGLIGMEWGVDREERGVDSRVVRGGMRGRSGEDREYIGVSIVMK